MLNGASTFTKGTEPRYPHFFHTNTFILVNIRQCTPAQPNEHGERAKKENPLTPQFGQTFFSVPPHLTRKSLTCLRRENICLR